MQLLILGVLAFGVYTLWRRTKPVVLAPPVGPRPVLPQVPVSPSLPIPFAFTPTIPFRPDAVPFRPDAVLPVVPSRPVRIPPSIFRPLSRREIDLMLENDPVTSLNPEILDLLYNGKNTAAMINAAVELERSQFFQGASLLRRRANDLATGIQTLDIPLPAR